MMNTPIRSMYAVVLLGLGCAVCAPAAVGVVAGQAGRAAITHHAQTVPESGMLHVASTGAQAELLTEAQVREVAVGTWSGRWSSDTVADAGEVVIKVESARDGAISGSGTSSGGPCSRNFRMSGSYQGSLVQLNIEFAEGDGECSAKAIRISMHMGRQGSKFVGAGH